MSSINSNCIDVYDIDWNAARKNLRATDFEEKVEEANVIQLLEKRLDEADAWERIIHTDFCPHEHTGAPDFLVERKSNSLLGVEVTTLTDGSAAQQSTEKNDVLEKAEVRFRTAEAGPAKVNIQWADYAGKIPDRDALAAEIATVANALLPAKDQGVATVSSGDIYRAKFAKRGDPTLHSLSHLPRYVSELSVYRWDDGQTTFLSPNAGFIPEFNTDALENAIEKKAKKHNQYAVHANEVWLALAYSHRRGERSPSNELDAELTLERKLQTPFDRVYGIELDKVTRLD